MSEKLLLAKYKDGLIQYSEYQESEHQGKLYCPFCDPPIRVTHNIKGFFMAWRTDGGHNCGKAREQAKYIDADWKGRKIIEISRDQSGALEITIDINALVYAKSKSTTGTENNIDGSHDKKDQDIFPIYKDREEVFRDVVRSVYQMKRILENNDQQFLNNLKFKFRTNDGVLSLNDIVFKLFELNSSIVGKSRFVIFKVESTILSNGVLYINSLSAKGINLAAKLNYPYDKNPFKNFKDEYVIAFGRVTYSKNFNRYFINLTNDFQIRKLKEEVGAEFFNEIEFQKYDYKVFVKPKESAECIKSKVNEVIVNEELSVIRERINSCEKVESQDEYVDKKSLINENVNKPKPNKLNEVKIKPTENIEPRTYYNKEDRPIADLDMKLGGIFSGVKKIFKSLIGK